LFFSYLSSIFTSKLIEMKRELDTEFYREYETQGMGNLWVSISNQWQCGGRTGFSISIGGEPGGVLPNEEALKLANYILETINKDNETKETTQTDQGR